MIYIQTLTSNFFFFFQAEDGIRDHCVTGVQTCALPILNRLAQEDPSFQVTTDHETGQTIIAGMGELHLEIIVDRMKREFGVEANVGKPQVAYRETITKAAAGKEIFKKQSGGPGQFAHVE